MMTSESIRYIADGLVFARRNSTVWQPDMAQPICNKDAYAVQDAVAAILGWFPTGRAPAWKVGGPGRLADITAAPLPFVSVSPVDWTGTGYNALSVEAEVAFRLGSTPSEGTNIISCIDTMCVAIEIVATRLEDGLNRPGPWKLADQQLHADLIIGAEVPFLQRHWLTQECVLEINGNVSFSANGSHPCGDPLYALPWLVQHAHQRGLPLRSGDLVTTGSWSGITPVCPGDRIRACFPGIGEAALQIVV